MKEIKEAKIEIGLFTYKDMSKPDMRDLMDMRSVSSLGTQAGNFGKYQEQFRVLSKSGARKIVMELEATLGSTDFLGECETLMQLLR